MEIFEEILIEILLIIFLDAPVRTGDYTLDLTLDLKIVPYDSYVGMQVQWAITIWYPNLESYKCSFFTFQY